MLRKKPPAFGATLAALRFQEGWPQNELAAAHGLTGSALSKLESGETQLSRERLDAMAATMGLKPEAVDRQLAARHDIEALRNAAKAERRAAPLAAAERETRWAAGQLGEDLEEAGRKEFGPLARSLAVEQERARGRESAAWLLGRPRADWALLVRGAREYQGQAVCMAVCELSEEAAADKPERALELARLAVLIAEQTPEDLALQGYAKAFLANAWRGAGKPRAAEPVMGESKALWEQGEPGILPPARILDLEASLLRAQRRFDEALTLLERALELSPDDASRGRVLLKKGFTLEQQGDLEGAVAALRQAAPLIDVGTEPRLACVLRYNLVVILIHADRLTEAEELLAEVWELAGELGFELDLLRTRWLSARLLAARGRTAEAAAEMQEVQGAFARRGILYATGVATLELAVLRLELGQTAEVQRLARQTYEILMSQGVQREALGSLLLFFEVAERRAVTLELVRDLLHRYREQAAEREPGT